MSDLKMYLATMGCQMNIEDSERMTWLMTGQGYRPVDSENQADLIIINTCSVREKAENKAVSLLGRYRTLKKANPDLVIVMAGCLAQQEAGRLLKRFDYLDVVLGTGETDRLPELVARARDKKRTAAARLDKQLPPPMTDNLEKVALRTQVTIMQGCDNFCAYCVVPHLRGRERSRPPADILAEVRAKLAAGTKEINLLGQNVNSYRHGDWDFVRLLREVSRVEGLNRLLFTTSHPKDMNRELAACFRDLPNLLNFVHLPFQSGSNRILKAMNRRYTREHYLSLVKQLREMRPDVALSADVIVGFPGETEDDFRETLDLIGMIRFDHLFSFRYSDRPLTKASRMDNKIPREEAAERLIRLQAVQRDITWDSNRALEGGEVEILVEGRARHGGLLAGRTRTNKVVNFAGDDDLIGRSIKVFVELGETNSLRARLIDR